MGVKILPRIRVGVVARQEPSGNPEVPMIGLIILGNRRVPEEASKYMIRLTRN